MINWQLLQPRNLAVIITISMVAYAGFLHFSGASSKSGDKTQFATKGV